MRAYWQCTQCEYVLSDDEHYNNFDWEKLEAECPICHGKVEKIVEV